VRKKYYQKNSANLTFVINYVKLDYLNIHHSIVTYYQWLRDYRDISIIKKYPEIFGALNSLKRI